MIQRRAVAFALAAGVAFGSTLVLAQSRPASPHGHHGKPRVAVDAGSGEKAQAEATLPPTARGAVTDAGAVEAKTLDGGTRVFRFGEVEIEGRLRNPQLVYFLRRVRAEFAAGDLGHRTFMRELSDTRHDPSF
jgi:hypothetical protein